MKTVTVENINAFRADLDAKTWVFDCLPKFFQFFLRIRKRLAPMQSHQTVVDEFGQAVHFPRRKQNSPGQICLAHRLAGVFADLSGENRPHPQFRTNTQQHGIHPHGIGMGQFSEVAYTHEHLHIGMPSASFVVTHQGVGKTKVDRVEDGIDQKFASSPLHSGNGTVQRIQVLVPGWNQDWRRGHCVANPQGKFI